jgi:hypothetical protein
MLQYSILHTEKVLRQNIALLKMAISDQNLELIPDYEQRIEVLQDLQFIDENSTVLLKGRVACEVRKATSSLPTAQINSLDQLCQRTRLDRADPREYLRELQPGRSCRATVMLRFPGENRRGAQVDRETRGGQGDPDRDQRSSGGDPDRQKSSRLGIQDDEVRFDGGHL